MQWLVRLVRARAACGKAIKSTCTLAKAGAFLLLTNLENSNI